MHVKIFFMIMSTVLQGYLHDVVVVNISLVVELLVVLLWLNNFLMLLLYVDVTAEWSPSNTVAVVVVVELLLVLLYSCVPSLMII